MQILLLGTAAGGGVPQWNCNCTICREARIVRGRVRPRTQSSVAISADGEAWFLLNASPDIRSQIETTPALRPHAKQLRGSPIEAVLLTNADLDHTLGLLLMREGKSLFVHATRAVRRSLTEGLSLAPALGSFCRTEWIEAPLQIAPLLTRDGRRTGLIYQALTLAGRPPRFARKGTVEREEPGPSGSVEAQGEGGLEARAPGGEEPGLVEASGDVVGYRIIDEKTGGRLLFLPDVASMDERVMNLLTECDALLFDGTFWSENEMLERGVGSQPASSMGHVPISGDDGSLKALAELRLKHKVYIHINNTNPILFEDSPEREAVMKAGCQVGMDGTEISI